LGEYSDYKMLVPTSQLAQCISITKVNQSMLFMEIIAVDCENHTEHTNTMCGQYAEFLIAEESGTYS
jgi:hypothetical protein